MDQTDEYEQGERVRAWLRNNGSSLITGIALGLAAGPIVSLLAAFPRALVLAASASVVVRITLL